MMRVLVIIFAIHLSLGASLSAQDTSIRNIQPTIMVIPFTKENQNFRSTFENNELVRIGITKVKEGFDSRGVNTIDLRAKLKTINNNAILEEDQKSTLKDEVIKLSGADIYVEVEANKNYNSSGNSMTIIMTAFDAFSGESFANKVATSNKFYTEDFEKLTEKAVESEIDNLLNTIVEKYADIQENGRTVSINFGIDEMADFDFDSEYGDGELLAVLSS